MGDFQHMPQIPWLDHIWDIPDNFYTCLRSLIIYLSEMYSVVAQAQESRTVILDVGGER